jgi:hypothetical protein
MSTEAAKQDSAWEGTLLVDAPSDLTAENDAFGHAAYADVLVRVLSRGIQPLTLGLLGPWGVGKSSVLDRAAAVLSARETAGVRDNAVVRFDAWRYDGDTLRRQLIREAAHQLGDQGLLRRRKFRVRRRLAQLDYDEQVTAERFALPRLVNVIFTVLQAAVLGGLLYAALHLHAIKRSFADLDGSNGVTLTIAFSLITLATTLFGQILRPVPTVRTLRRLEDPERFLELFRALVAATKTERLIIMVDNLDRCPAGDALALLATIKTYLEPAARDANGAQVLFVLAVDEASLRRHLRKAGDDGLEADEYLRKIFSATIRFAPLHADDLRAYVGTQVAAIDSKDRLNAEQRRGLTALVDAAFRDSPRQVIQFLNTFQLRMGLFGTQLRDPLVVAKLAIIEERWPTRYAGLKQEPEQLGQWHEEALDTAFVADANDEEWPGLADFLRISDHLRPTDLRPYVGLRRVRQESDLPEFARFRAALIAAKRDEVGRVLDAHPGLERAYSEEATNVFEVELEDRNAAAARSVLDVVLTDPRLTGASALVGRAVMDLRLRDQLPSLPADELLAAAAGLTGAQRTTAVTGVISRLHDKSRERSRTAAAALAGRVAMLLPAERAALREALAAGPPRFDELAAFAAADASLITAAVIDRLTETVRVAPASLVDPSEGPALREVVRVAAETQPDHEAVARLVDMVVRSLDAFSTDQMSAVFALLAEIVESAGARTTDAEMLIHLLPRLPIADRPAAFDRLWARALVSTDVRGLTELTVIARDDPDLVGAASWKRRLTDLPESMLPPVLDAFGARLPATGDREDRIELLRSLGRDPSETIIADVRGRMQAGDATAALWLVEHSGQLPNSDRSELAKRAMLKAETAATPLDAVRWLRVVGRLSIATPQSRSLTAQVLDGFFASGEWPEDLDDLDAAIEVGRTLGDETISGLTDPLLATITETTDSGNRVDALRPVRDDLTSDQRTRLAEATIHGWASHPEDRVAWDERVRILAPNPDPAAIAAMALALPGTNLGWRRRLLDFARAFDPPTAEAYLARLDASDDPDDQRLLEFLHQARRPPGPELLD